jgi:hypothetical protein
MENIWGIKNSFYLCTAFEGNGISFSVSDGADDL